MCSNTFTVFFSPVIGSIILKSLAVSLAAIFKSMMQLPNGCYCSDPIISPKNCKTTDVDWMVYCRFYDPVFKNEYPEGFPVVKKGMNRQKDIHLRRQISDVIKKALVEKLRDRGYNPITKKFMVESIKKDYEIDPETPMIDALKAGLIRLQKRYEKLKDKSNVKKLEPNTLANIKCALKAFTTSAIQLRYNLTPIKDVKRRHIVSIIENCNKSPDRENKIKAYLSTIFKELVKVEAIETNPTREIEKNQIITKERTGFTKKQMEILDTNLHQDHYELWRLMHIFYHSGGRKTELCSVKAKDVSLSRQTYKCLVKKGGLWLSVEKVIKDAALPYWVDLLKNCSSEDFILGKGFKPGPQPTNPDFITKLWKKIVKDNNERYPGIDVDFYELKHQNTTDTITYLMETKNLIKSQAQQIAAEQNSHTSLRMVQKVYDIKNEGRDNDLLKSVGNVFGK